MRTAASSSQAVNALLKLREFILGGEIKAGERMSELALVELTFTSVLAEQRKPAH